MLGHIFCQMERSPEIMQLWQQLPHYGGIFGVINDRNPKTKSNLRVIDGDIRMWDLFSKVSTYGLRVEASLCCYQGLIETNKQIFLLRSSLLWLILAFLCVSRPLLGTEVCIWPTASPLEDNIGMSQREPGRGKKRHTLCYISVICWQVVDSMSEKTPQQSGVFPPLTLRMWGHSTHTLHTHSTTCVCDSDPCWHGREIIMQYPDILVRVKVEWSTEEWGTHVKIIMRDKIQLVCSSLTGGCSKSDKFILRYNIQCLV